MAATSRPRLKKRCVDFVPSLIDTRHNLPGSRSLFPVPLRLVLFSLFPLYSLVTPGLIISLLLDSPLCRMSRYSSRLTRRSSSSPTRHFPEYRSARLTQVSVSAQGAAARANVTPMLGPSWLLLSPPPRHRLPRRQRAQFPSPRWYSSKVRSLASRGQRLNFPHTYTRPLVSWRLAGTLRSQLRHNAKTRAQLAVIISDQVQGITSWIIFPLAIYALEDFCGLRRFISLLPCQSDPSGTIGFIVYTCPTVKTPFDLIYAS